MNQEEKTSYGIEKGHPLPLGVTANEDGNRVNIACWAKGAKTCGLKLFIAGKPVSYIPMPAMTEHGVKDVFAVQLTGENVILKLNHWEYIFEVDKYEVMDPYAKSIVGRDRFGRQGKIRAKFFFEEFDWSGENRKEIAFKDQIVYQCHTRGFTKHQSSGVKHPGTFIGVTEKLDYLKELGVNTLLFLPVYDFNERMKTNDEKKKLNYWGYTKDAFYFAPKASYGTGELSPVNEFKQMVKQLHQNGFEVFLDMHFEEKTPDFILNCLRHYVIEFHIDGFLLNQNIVATDLVLQDPILDNVKLLGAGWREEDINKGGKRLACFNDNFLTNARRFLKSDEGQVVNFYHGFKNIGGNVAVINYISEKNGFTLQDLVSYDVKHNEANGERNQDGTEYNYSWNCGQEGATRRKKVQQMRRKQVKNALSMLLLSLGTPMILAGDEFGNSQGGNNNAYCQDNTTTWLNWTLLDKNKSVFEFTKMLIQVRKTFKFYQADHLSGIDYEGTGVPDISCHGIEPWKSDFVNYSRELAVLFYGSYFPIDADTISPSVYIAFNMHWEPHTFFLPKIGKKDQWDVLFDTSNDQNTKIIEQNRYVLDPRSIAVLISTSEPRSMVPSANAAVSV